MDPFDPNSRALRGAISGAVRTGDREGEIELRRELSLCNIERTFDRELGVRLLSAVELRRLRMALDSYAADPNKRAAVAQARQQESEQIRAEIQSQIADLQARLAATVAAAKAQPVNVTQSV